MIGETVFFIIVAAVAVVAATLPEFIRGVRLYGGRGLFRCISCGNCCRFRVIPITADDVSRLESGGFSGFADRYKGETCMKRIKGRCVFLTDDRCGVYDHRPKVCRSFPFFISCRIGQAQKASFCPAMEKLENG
ncbi:MAG: YkgJ family cysteine cluster protein [Candidatus Altiarchaeota archaeon]